jgi:hypothetical protein
MLMGVKEKGAVRSVHNYHTVPLTRVQIRQEVTRTDINMNQTSEDSASFMFLHQVVRVNMVSFLISPQIGINIIEDGHDSEKLDEVAVLGYYNVNLKSYNILMI